MHIFHTLILCKKLCNIRNAITLVFEVRSHYFYTIFYFNLIITIALEKLISVFIFTFQRSSLLYYLNLYNI